MQALNQWTLYSSIPNFSNIDSWIVYEIRLGDMISKIIKNGIKKISNHENPLSSTRIVQDRAEKS